ncbi:MAG: hypothetical protein IBX55_06580 [Methyloprofundus sp.]|nr:hypothetical protein [Methyloprofundus sp.]MBW6454124.1 hypothetical protein [Methyloprofundus sp.]
MKLGQKIVSSTLNWFLALLKVVVVLFILGIAKVILRTNPDIAVSMLGAAAILFILWYFVPQIKRFLNNE